MARHYDTERDKRLHVRLAMLTGIAPFVTGLVFCSVALTTIVSQGTAVAQMSSPASPGIQSPSDASKQSPASMAPEGKTSGSSAPAESKPGGTRPTTPAPEPARPDADAQNAGAPTALPAAPAEKVAPPMEAK
jgi:hypothetical protein